VARPPAGRSGPSRDEIAARARAWVERTCLDQGVNVALRDPLAIEKAGELLNQGRQTGRKRPSSKRL
jgi:hypothetical protein